MLSKMLSKPLPLEASFGSFPKVGEDDQTLLLSSEERTSVHRMSASHSGAVAKPGKSYFLCPKITQVVYTLIYRHAMKTSIQVFGNGEH